MLLRDYIPRGKRSDFARQLGVKVSYLHKLCVGQEQPGIALVLKIERATLGRVTKHDLRPDLFGPSNSDAAA